MHKNNSLNQKDTFTVVHTPDLKAAPATYNSPHAYIAPRCVCADVTIVVGGQEFGEFSQNLLCWSGYFCAEITRCAEKGFGPGRFDFPDCDPKEWEWIASLMEPLPSETITAENVLKALPWFELLQVDRGLAICDTILAQEMESTSTHFSPFDVLEASIRYNLPAGKTSSCNKILSMVEQPRRQRWNSKKTESPTLDDMERLVRCIRMDRECREALWGATEPVMPECSGDKDSGDLPETVTIPLHLYLHLKIKESSYSGDPTVPVKKNPAPAPAPRPAARRSFLDSDSDSDSDSSVPVKKRPPPAPAPRPAARRSFLDSDSDSDSDSS